MGDLRFPGTLLDGDLVHDLMRDNPWWRGLPGLPLPPVRRHVVADILKRLEQRLAPIVMVRGPRQVGKTTAQLQVIEDLLSRPVQPSRIFRVQCDDLPALSKVSKEPILRLVDWYEATVLKRTLNQAAQENLPAYLFFDEVQNLADWAVQLKHLVDTSSVRVVVTGSSALRIEQGRDSLAGRITSLDVGTLSLREIAAIRHGLTVPALLPDNGLEALGQKEFWLSARAPADTKQSLAGPFEAFSEFGGYPIVHARREVPWPDLADQLNETVIKRVIQHDLRIGERGRKRDAALLEELFRRCCRYAGQAPKANLFAREAQRALHTEVGVQRVRFYLDFLDKTLLVRRVRPLEIRLKRSQVADKLCLADHGLRASWLQEVVPLAPEKLDRLPHLADLAGHLAESIVGAFLLTLHGLDLAHFPERSGEPEVDFILTIGAQRIPLEVKYRRVIDPWRDTEGLRSFLEKTAYNARFGILVTQRDDVNIEDPRIVALSLPSLLALR